MAHIVYIHYSRANHHKRRRHHTIAKYRKASLYLSPITQQKSTRNEKDRYGEALLYCTV